jgi:hypothetical protein
MLYALLSSLWAEVKRVFGSREMYSPDPKIPLDKYVAIGYNKRWRWGNDITSPMAAIYDTGRPETMERVEQL